jgi:hypothetical protein
MPPSPSERDLYEELLVAMGGIFTHGTSVTTLRHRIRALARQLEVRLLVIDEIHSVLAGRGCKPDCVNDLVDSDTQSRRRSNEAGRQV